MSYPPIIKFFLVLTLAVTSVACQQQASVDTQPDKPKISAQGITAKQAKPLSKALATASLKKQMLVLLGRYDLSPLWNDPHGTYRQTPVLDGFIGSDKQHLALTITAVHRDAVQPQLFWVTGKSRLKRVVTPFTGTLLITKIIDLQDGMVAPGESADSTNYLYTATGSFHFKQLAGSQAGELSGRAFFDFMITSAQKMDMVTTIMTNPNDKFPAKGCGLVLRGHWISPSTKQRKAVLLARDVFVIAPELYTDFGIGDRGTIVNPKYAKLGWSESWENDEWWADSPRPHLSL